MGQDRLTGKVAVVTGGASGIGLATSELLAANGATVVIADIDGDAAAKAAARLGCGHVRMDVTDPAEWTRLTELLEREHGGADIGYLNAGISTRTPEITDLTDETYRRIMSINVDGVVYGARALVPLLARRGGGSLVATSSLAGLIAFAPDPIYTLTKHAVVGLVRALAPTVAERGITVNAVCPGLTDTPLLGGRADDLRKAGFPLIEPERIAEAVLGCVLGTETGQAYVCQAGREPTPYRFRGVPGPEGGAAPPQGFRDPNITD